MLLRQFHHKPDICLVTWKKRMLVKYFIVLHMSKVNLHSQIACHGFTLLVKREMLSPIH